MPSVFQGKTQGLGGVIRAEDVTLTFPGVAGAGGATGALVQQAQLTCERTVNMIYEIGSNKVYYVGDRRRGTAQFNRIVGGSDTFKSMISQFGNICNSLGNNIKMEVGEDTNCDGTKGGMTYNMLDATLTSLGASVNANDIVVTESMNFMFVDLDYGDGEGG